MYTKIQKQKTMGYSRESTARKLGISWRTVDKYWDMTVDEYRQQKERCRFSRLDKHENAIKDWLTCFPDMTAAQVTDRLLEHYQVKYPEHTVRTYVNQLRIKHNLPKPVKNPREYGCVEELPPGQQLQADFGEYWALREKKRRIKLHVVVFILAHSRYKYILWQNHPFTSIDFIRCLEACFEALGGIPQELVIDQDKLMTVSENHGDIIHTYEFERCKNRHGLDVWLCRKEDPESKGTVEACVKFVKYNFAKCRYFVDIHRWNQDCFDWLERTGNGREHSETKKIPAEVFAVEKQYLKPYMAQGLLKTTETMVSTPVRKNNTIRYKGSRYSVPVGTYTKYSHVLVQEKDGQLEIYITPDQLLHIHPLATAPGSLVKNNNHDRDTSESINQLMKETLLALGNTPQAAEFLQILRKKKPRYIRDQLNHVLKTVQIYEPETVRLAILACLESKVYSANDFRDFSDYLFHQITLEQVMAVQSASIPTSAAPPASDKLTGQAVVQPLPEAYMKHVSSGGKHHE